MAIRFGSLPISLDIKYLAPDVTEEMLKSRFGQLERVDEMLRSRRCAGGEMTGWIEPDSILTADEMSRLKSTARRLAEETDVLLVIGVGGSYLGARAVIEALGDNPDRVVYAGQNISAHYTARLRRTLKGKRVAINVVSKSGTTTEPAIAFRVLRDLAGSDAAKKIVATTDANKGALLKLARKEGYETFVVPDDIGGRYSVLSAVGLLPIAYAGVDVDKLVAGAVECAQHCVKQKPDDNPAYYYAAARNVLYHQGFNVEILATFEPRLHYLAEWWKQLYGESEGKEHCALWPDSVDYTTDLHSLGQYVQQGRRILAETFLTIETGEPVVRVPSDQDDVDGMNYLGNKLLSFVNSKAYLATARAHRDGGVPNLSILVKKLDARGLGCLIYFFELACALSGLALGVNPFDQPGVEAYKKIMFKLLGKPT
jgi:glucose-6-phosphate isomerase